MSDQLSSEAAKGFAAAGVAVLGVIAINRIRKSATQAWRNWRSNEKPETEPAK